MCQLWGSIVEVGLVNKHILPPFTSWHSFASVRELFFFFLFFFVFLVENSWYVLLVYFLFVWQLMTWV